MDGGVKADVIVPYSVGKYLAEAFHSASCGTAAQCFADPAKCTPSGSQNLFGCDTHVTTVINKVNGTAPTTPFPPTSKSVISSTFSATFSRFLFEVVASPTAGTLGIPSYLQPYFGPKGYTCANSDAKEALKAYGFRVLTAGSAPGQCGSLS